MGLLISINGADFNPYEKPIAVDRDLTIHKIAKTGKASHATEFQKTLAEQSTKPPAINSSEQKKNQYADQKFRKAQEFHERQQARHAKHVSDLMTEDAVFIDSQADVDSAIEKMAKRSIRHLPVVDSNEKVIGIISDRDLLLVNQSKNNEVEGVTVFDLMTKKVVLALPTTLIVEAAEAMIDQRISGLPVVDHERKLVGILTTTDLLRSFLSAPNLELWT